MFVVDRQDGTTLIGFPKTPYSTCFNPTFSKTKRRCSIATVKSSKKIVRNSTGNFAIRPENLATALSKLYDPDFTLQHPQRPHTAYNLKSSVKKRFYPKTTTKNKQIN
jgi:hypothetical protein